MFTATGYYDTGFDIINVPDSQQLLRNCARIYQTFPALDILNKRFLSSIRIKINPAMGEKDLDGLDYIELKEDGDQSGIFYYVTGYSLTSKDVAVLNVVQDSFLTAGGTQGVNGMIVVKRSHIAKADDYFGAYCEDDELLCPNEPLLMVYGGATTDIRNGDNVKMGTHRPSIGQFFCFSTDTAGGTAFSPNTVVCSTVGFKWLGSTNINRSDILDGTHMDKFGSSAVGEWGTENVEISIDAAHVYPDIPKAAGADVYLSDPYVKVTRSSETVAWDATQWPPYKGVGYDGVEYHNLDQYSAESLATLRMVGMEDAIISCYRLNPGEGICTNGTGTGALTSRSRLQGQKWLLNTNDRENNGGQYRILGSSYYDYDYMGNLYSANEGGQVHNERILYGKFRKYVISSPATGSMAEALPEELTARRFKTGWNSTAGASNVGWQGAPTIAYFSDPRPTGRPYYNFVKIGQRLSIYDQTINTFYMSLTEGAIAGGQWPEVPIVFTGMAGEFQARVGYELSASYSDYLASPERTYRNMVSGAQMANYTQRHNTSSIDQSFVNQTMAGAAGGALFGPEGAVIGGIGGAAKGALGYVFNDYNANMTYKVNLEAANRDMLLGATGNYNEAMQGNVTANAQIERMRARDYERAQFELSTMYQVPRAKFMATESMRDFTGNCLFYARYTPTVNDLKRMDAILDAYGYKRNEEKASSQLYAVRPNFVYIEGSFSKMQIPDGVVGKKEIMQDINSQFANGIRIWHRSPKNQGLYPGV